MTISTTDTKVSYTGNGATTAFAVPFVFFGETEIEVVERTIATGSEVTKTLSTHYSVTGGGGATGTVTAVTAPASTVEWHIRRRTARTQLTDYTPNDPFPAETHEIALDRLTAIGQEIGEVADRALVVPVTDSSSISLDLPNSVDRAGKFLVFAADGSPAVAEGTGTGGAGTTGVAGLLELATDGETQTGTDTARAITPANLASRLPVSSSAFAGFQQSSAAGVLEATGPNMGHKNALLNGRFWINQRTILATVVADNAYGPDRWRYLGEASATLTAEQSISGDYSRESLDIKFTGTTDKGGIFQVIEFNNATHMRNKTLAFSALMKVSNTRLGNIKMGILKWSGAGDATTGDPISSWGADGVTPTLAANWAFLNTPANMNVTTSLAQYTVTAAYGTTYVNLAVLIWNDDKSYTANDTLSIGECQLEIGSVRTPFEHRPFQHELSLCQRYYEKSFAYATAPAQNVGAGTGEHRFGQIVAASTVAQYAVVPFLVRKRAAPTVTLYNPAATNAQARNITGSTDFTSTAATATERGFSFVATSPGGSAAGNIAGLHWVADAEI